MAYMQKYPWATMARSTARPIQVPRAVLADTNVPPMEPLEAPTPPVPSAAPVQPGRVA